MSLEKNLDQLIIPIIEDLNNKNYDNVIERLQTLRMTPERRERLSQVRASSYEYLMTPANFLTMTYMAMFNVVCNTIEASQTRNAEEHISTVLRELVQINKAAKAIDAPEIIS